MLPVADTDEKCRIAKYDNSNLSSGKEVLVWDGLRLCLPLKGSKSHVSQKFSSSSKAILRRLCLNSKLAGKGSKEQRSSKVVSIRTLGHCTQNDLCFGSHHRG